MSEQPAQNVSEDEVKKQKTPAEIKANGVSKYSYQNRRNEIGIARYR